MALNRRVSLNNPEEDAIRRRQQLSDALMKQSIDPIQIQNYQGIQAPIPVTEGLNKILAGALGGYEDKRATQEGEDLRTRRKDEASKYVKALDGWTNPDAVGASGNEAPAQVPLSGDDRKRLLLQGLTSDNDRVQGAASTLYAQDNQAPKTVTTAEGIFILKPDGTTGERLGTPFNSSGNGMGPMNVQEYEYFKKLSPDEQTHYLTVKRANNPMNLGGSYQFANPANPAGPAIASVPTTLKPGDVPATRESQAEAAAVGTGTGQATVAASNRARGAERTLDILDGVETLIDKSTSSGAGAARDAAGNLIGQSSNAADATAALKVIQGNVMLAMPRMEGPQSDRDTQLYRENAAKLAEPIPASQRKAAVAEIRRIQEKYKAEGPKAPNKADDPLGLR